MMAPGACGPGQPSLEARMRVLSLLQLRQANGTRTATLPIIAIALGISTGCVQPVVVSPFGAQRVVYVRSAQQKAEIEARQIVAMHAAITLMCSDSAISSYPSEQVGTYRAICGGAAERTVAKIDKNM